MPTTDRFPASWLQDLDLVANDCSRLIKGRSRLSRELRCPELADHQLRLRIIRAEARGVGNADCLHAEAIPRSGLLVIIILALVAQC